MPQSLLLAYLTDEETKTQKGHTASRWHSWHLSYLASFCYLALEYFLHVCLPTNMQAPQGRYIGFTPVSPAPSTGLDM